MIQEIENGTIIEAELISETKDAFYLNCEGDKHWFPKKFVRFSKEEKELDAPNWLLRKTFPNENF